MLWKTLCWNMAGRYDLFPCVCVYFKLIFMFHLIVVDMVLLYNYSLACGSINISGLKSTPKSFWRCCWLITVAWFVLTVALKLPTKKGSHILLGLSLNPQCAVCLSFCTLPNISLGLHLFGRKTFSVKRFHHFRTFVSL